MMKISINDVVNLYKEGIPIRELSRNLKVSRTHIRKILIGNGINIRDSRLALINRGYIEQRKRFNIDSKEKAYLFGLTIGDLTPVKRSSHNLRLVTNTTHMTFISLLESTFKKYGYVNYWLNKGKNDFQFHASLDFESFSFLMDKDIKNIPPWIDQKDFMDFLAGFIDSDGSILLNRARTRIKYGIRFFGQNKEVLSDIKNRLNLFGYTTSLSKTHSEGRIIYYKGVKFVYNKDYYTLECSRKKDVLSLLERIPVRHPEKIQRKKLALTLLNSDLTRWKDAEKEILQLRDRIKKSVELKIIV